jgi:hypothetical protein
VIAPAALSAASAAGQRLLAPQVPEVELQATAAEMQVRAIGCLFLILTLPCKGYSVYVSWLLLRSACWHRKCQRLNCKRQQRKCR